MPEASGHSTEAKNLGRLISQILPADNDTPSCSALQRLSACRRRRTLATSVRCLTDADRQLGLGEDRQQVPENPRLQATRVVVFGADQQWNHKEG